VLLPKPSRFSTSNLLISGVLTLRCRASGDSLPKALPAAAAATVV
jgi:hypothetical protein